MKVKNIIWIVICITIGILCNSRVCMAYPVEIFTEQGEDVETASKEDEQDVKASAVLVYSKEDYNALLKIVEAEAGICDKKGKVLVANVIINRVNHDGFPDNITDVVYQNDGNTYQFSPVLDGRIDTVEISDDTVSAVNEALHGIDYSEGALYFAAREKANPKNMNWFDSSLTFLFEHDGHEFFTEKS